LASLRPPGWVVPSRWVFGAERENQGCVGWEIAFSTFLSMMHGGVLAAQANIGSLRVRLITAAHGDVHGPGSRAGTY
jgi:hypothetical protein